jgi:hypothetical protein
MLFEMLMQSWEVVKHIDVKDIAQLSHSLLPIFIIFSQLHLSEEVTSKEVGFLFTEFSLKHGFDNTMKPLNIAIATLLSTESS